MYSLDLIHVPDLPVFVGSALGKALVNYLVGSSDESRTVTGGDLI